jgi:uncharacterized protein YuzE
MALSSPSKLVLDYDQEADVLYASLGSPRQAVTDEVDEDILLRYCPPSRDVIGITLVNFRRHFPHEAPGDVIHGLLRKYPSVPWPDDGQEGD